MTQRPLSTLRSALAGCALAALASTPALAQATRDEARRLQAVGETYLGQAPAGQPSALTVTAEGDHYRAELDFGLLAKRLAAFVPEADRKPFEFEWPVAVSLTPLGNGLWRFSDYSLPRLSLRLDGERSEVTTDGIDVEVISNPATGESPSIKGRIAKIATKSTSKKPDQDFTVSADVVSTDVTMAGAARATAEPGVVDVALQQVTTTYGYGIALEGGAAGGVPDMTFKLDTGRQDISIGLRGFRNAALLDLWAHLVAHHAPTDFTTGQSALKAKLAAALPIFTNLTEKVAVAKVNFTSPFGIASADTFTGDVDLAGLTRDGRFAFTLGIAGVQAHSLFMPKWATRLVPRELALHGAVSGYDAATPLSVLLDSADFAAPKPLTDEQVARIAGLALPRGSAEIDLAGNRLANALYDIALDGRLTAGPAGAKGTVTVTAKGLEKVSEILADPTADDRARTFGAVIAQVEQLAERRGDALVWRVDFDGEAIAINGKPIK